MEKKRKSKIRKWDEVSGSVEVEEMDFTENPTEDPEQVLLSAEISCEA